MLADTVQKKSKKVNKRRRRSTCPSSSEQSDVATPKTSVTKQLTNLLQFVNNRDYTPGSG